MSSRILFLLIALSAGLAQAADTVPPAILATPPSAPEPGQPIVVEAQIVDESDVFDPTIFWRIAGESKFERISLVLTGDLYRAEIMPPEGALGIELYIEAFDMEGNGPARFGAPTLPMRVTLAAPPVKKPELDPEVVKSIDEKESKPERVWTGAAWQRPAAIGALAVGAALLVGGGVAIASQRSRATEFNSRLETQGLYDDAEASSIRAIGAVGASLLSVGGVALTAGGVLYLVEF